MKKIVLLLVVLIFIGCKKNTSEEKIPVESNNGIGDGATQAW